MTIPLTFGPASPVLIVAELSANHGGSLSRAMECIHAAAEVGVSAVKLQTYTPDTMTLDSARDEFTIRGGPWHGRRLYELYAEAQTPWEWHEKLADEAARRGLPLFSTPFDRSAVVFLEALGVPAHKIASFELTDLELIEAVAATRKPVIVSTGMATLGEIEMAVSVLRRVWNGADAPLALLRCVSAYPASPASMNLRALTHLGTTFSAIPGLSDHSLGDHVAVAAVALGAKVIEKHLTLRRADGGPDAAFSMEPEEMRQLVERIREVEAALGSVSYGPTSEETPSLRFRRSIFVVRDVRAGEVFTRENVRVIRPGHGMEPSRLAGVLGRKATRDCPRGTPLTPDLLG